MKSAKRFITACLTATMIFQALAPSTEVLAQEMNAANDAAVQAAFALDGAVKGAKSRAAEFASDAGKAIAADSASSSDSAASDTGGTNGTDASDAESGNASTGDVEQPTGDESGESTPGTSDDATSNDDVAADDAAQDNADDQADENADAEKAATGAQITTAEDLKKAVENSGGKSYGTVSVEGDKVTKVEFNDADALILISNTDPQIYQNANITRSGQTGGGIDVTGKSGDYTFQGFGGEDAPFAGKVDMGGVTLTVARTLYNGLSLTDDNGAVAVTWKGTGSDPIVARKLVGNGKALDATVTIADAIADAGTAKPSESDAGVTGALLGAVQGDMTLDAKYSFSGTRKGIDIKSTTDNAGLLVNTLASGKLTLKNLSGISDAKGTPTVATSAANAAAGGLIGCVNEGASVDIAGALDVSNLTVTATGNEGAAGGFIGRAKNFTLTFGKDADGKSVSVKPALKVGDASTMYAGGVIGDVSFASDVTIEPDQFKYDDSAVVELGAKKRAGGLFGRLDLTNGDVTVKGGAYRSKLATGKDSDADRGSYGGVAGNVCSASDDAIRALTIEKNDGTAAKFEIEREGNLCYVGGLVGYQDGDATQQRTAVVVDGAEVKINGAAYAYTDYGKLGGAVGVVDKNQLLDVRDFKLSSTNQIGEKGGVNETRGGSAGIAGSAWRGIIKFSGTTGLSDAKFADSDLAAQLVYQNYNALIFATGSGSDSGWTYKRPAAVTIDDIYSYGEVIRLGGNGGLSKDLIGVDPKSHALTLGTGLQKSGDAYVLNSVDDFAKLAITWQTFGYFSMVDDIGGGSVASLASSTINVARTIDLSGTGLTGLSKDRDDPGNDEGKADGGERETAHRFSGTLTGSGTINLAVGEPYGKRGNDAIASNDASDGNGKIYRHQRLGLFNAVTTNAQTSGGVTIGGTMRFENKADIDAGALAAQVVGTGGVTISDATFSTAIAFDSANTGKVLNVGGIFGSVADACALTLGTGAKAQAVIKNASNAADIRVGEAAGYVVGDKAATINVTGLEVGGSVTASGDCSKDVRALVGGLIGYIQQGPTEKAKVVEKTVKITGLSYESFSMSVGKNGDTRNGAGGLLGYSWGNTVVTIGDKSMNKDNGTYALKTTDSSVTANSVTEFGGLLYAMSGHLVINDYALDLSDASLSATNATSFGVLLARGGASNSDHKFGVEGAYSGLYLEDRANWATAYQVPGNGKILASGITTPDKTNFDEWVAATTRPGSTTMNGECNGLISLHTADKGNKLYNDGKLYMGVDASKDNSYQNRTAVGQAHKTNQNARYYYNLDRCLADASPSGTYITGETLEKGNKKYWVKSPQALMIWSACRNSPAGIRDYIAPNLNFDVTFGMQIGNNSDDPGKRTTLDLGGYSYYPVDVSGAQAIYNADITFHYSDIKNEQTKADNKSNAEYTQHANMHMALFRVAQSDFRVEKNVTLAGSVGRVVDGSDPDSGTGMTKSGALICRSIGSSKNPALNVTFNKVILDGLTVDDVDQKKPDSKEYVYAPLLINDFTQYVTLDVQQLSVKKDSYGADGSMGIAASSLFGKFGTENSNQVSASFHDNVELPSRKDKGRGIFTRASFFDSFGCGASNTGSATYVFNTKDKVTYGEEIDSNGTEHKKQLWYYDAPDYGNVSAADGSLVSDGSIAANNSDPQFGSKYLPYVYNRQVDDSGNPKPGYREMKVNQRPANLETGCGTYSDPYVVKNAKELYALTKYIRGAGNPDDGWKVTVTTDQNQVCTRRNDEKADYEATYQYSLADRKWKKVSGKDGVDSLDNDTMRLYMQSAYYSIEPADKKTNTIEVDASTVEGFLGFGSHDNPFRGVIVGDLGSGNATISIKGASGNTYGLVPYSYGSVVRNLNVKYDGGTNSIAYKDKYSSDATPQVMFGGVIGCIMGGDNIIDGVSVSSAGGFTVEGVNNSAGQKSYLVPVGGYVGAICGGGVIFRNMADSSWHENVTSKLYDNPYVGRVIDGYAFSEGCTVENGNDNYKVNELQNAGAPCVTTGQLYPRDNNAKGKAVTTTVQNEQGLLVLSAIINSGAAAGPTQNTGKYYGSYSGSAAYKGGEVKSKGSYSFGNGSYGKVRNAKYDAVGDPKKASAEGSDFKTAYKDDCQTPGAQSNCVSNAVTEQTQVNSPYLVSAYATKLTGYICAPNVSGMDLQFAEKGTPYDIRSYGLGFLGLSGRYYSNACVSNEKSQDRDRIVPAVARINGHKQTILVNNQFSQYSDDDYTVRAVGGLFSAVMYTNMPTCLNDDESIVTDLYFGDKDKASSNGKSSTVSLTFKNSAGETTTAPNQDYCVGMLAGVTANRDSLSASGKYSNIKLESCAIESPKFAGGLLGASGWGSRQTNDDTNSMIDFDHGGTGSPVKLVDCSYDDISVKGGTRVGGFSGAIGSSSDSGVWVTKNDFVVGQNSTLEATGDNCVMGGIVGLAWSKVSVNVKQGDDDSTAYQTAKLSEVIIKNGKAVTSESLTGTGSIVGNPKAGMDISKVEISSSKSSSAENPTYLGALNPPANFKRVGGIAGQIDSGGTYTVTDATIKNIRISANDSAAGVVGSLRNGAQVACDGVTVEGCQINGRWSGGIVGAIGDVKDSAVGNPSAVTVTNSIIRQNNFINENVGGIAGDGRGTFRLSNVLLDKNGFSQAQTKGQGLLIGIVGTDYASDNGQFGGVFASGIDIIPANVDGKNENAVLPDLIRAANDDILKAVHLKSYVAFADYCDASTKTDATGHYNGDGSSLYNDEGGAVASAGPYVTTNPVADNPQVKISDKKDAAAYSLFGDGVAISTAATIQTEASTPVAGRYTYTNIGGCDKDGNYQNTNGYESSSKSTFNDSNPDSTVSKVDANKNFNVLVIPGNDTTTVTNYLNLVTNGGFSDAVRLNPDTKSGSPFVTAKAEMFTLENKDSGTFVRSSDAASLQVVKDGTKSMSFRASTAWDNNQARFTLLTVTFNDGAGHKYKVQVPIVVKRMLEINFSATYTYGTNYKASDYDKLQSHVLTGMGDTMTGYLTWTYNKALGDDSVRYGLDTLLDSGGALKPVEKSIVFDGDKTAGALPVDTQLTLVDTGNNSKQYTYTVTAEDTVTSGSGDSSHAVTTIPLTKFVDSSNPAKSYQEQWLSELMGVTATQNDNGGWVQLDSTEDTTSAVAKVGGSYYRLYKDGDKVGASKRYELSMLDKEKKSKERTVSENFFLVVRVPKNATKIVNGYTTTSVSAQGVNTNINDVRRYNNSIANDHSNNESTYGIAASYGQALTDNNGNKEASAGDNVVKMTINDSDTVYKNLKLDVTDTVTLGENEYNSNDALYFQLNSALAKFENGSSAGAVGYPEGAKINNLSFYVMVGDGYYKWNGSSWEGPGKQTCAVDPKNIEAHGNDLSLVLSNAQGEPIDLKSIRDIAKNKDKAFSIRVTADVELTEPQCQAAIMASQDGSSSYTKPTYRSFLSTHAESLSTSSMTGDNAGKVRYYRPDIGSSTIALIASKKTQLGINVNDLSSADGTIALVGTYDMSKLNGADAKIDKATTLTYTLTLQRRDDGTYTDVPNIGEYVTVKESDHLGTGSVSGGSIVFTDTKGENGFATRDGTSSAFKHRFVVKVNTNVESAQQFYANYRLVLTAHLVGDGVDDTPANVESIANYPNSDYVTYTITKVETKGISHGNK